MVAQLTNQDPLNPLESNEFIAQVAQFSTVNGIKQVQESIGELATSFQSGQALQASTMVGRDVLVPGQRGVLHPWRHALRRRRCRLGDRRSEHQRACSVGAGGPPDSSSVPSPPGWPALAGMGSTMLVRRPHLETTSYRQRPT